MNITDIDRDIATIRNLTSRIDAMLMLLEVPSPHGRFIFDVELVGVMPPVFVHGLTPLDRHQHTMGFRIARVDVVAIVGTDHTNIVTVTDLQQHLVVGVLLFEVVILKFEKEIIVAKDGLQPLSNLERSIHIPTVGSAFSLCSWA